MGPGEALQRSACAEVSALFVEEPLLSDNVQGHRKLRGARVPIAMGEQLCNRFEFWNYVQSGAADYLQPDVWKVGGITEWLHIAALGAAANLDISPHASLELSQHLAGAVPNALRIENIFGLNLYDFGATAKPLPIKAGRLALTGLPGHGVVMDGPSLAENEVTGSGAIPREPMQHAGV